MKKYLIMFGAVFCMALTAVSANAINLKERILTYSSYGSGYAWDDTLNARNTAERLNTKYTLGDSRAQGTAYVYDSGGKVITKATATYVEHPATAKYLTTDANLMAHHTHKIIDSKN